MDANGERFEAVITVNLAAVQAKLNRGLQRAIDMVRFALIAAERVEPFETADVTVPGAHIGLGPASNEARSFEDLREEFPLWVLESGLQNCADELGVVLDEVHKACAVWQMGTGAGEIRGEEWNAWWEQFNREVVKFHTRGIPNKIEVLQQTYSPSLRPEVTDEVLSINQARNCLVHRRGVVSPPDLHPPTDPDALRVRWIKMELVIEGPAGRRVVTPPADVQAGEVVLLRTARTEKVFRLGERVMFSAQEFIELCFTYQLFGNQLVQNLEAYGRTLGISFAEPSGGESQHAAPS